MRKRVVLEERNGVVGKECTKCNEWKGLESGFSREKRGLGGRASHCKVCRWKYSQKWREDNHERHLETQRSYRKRNPDICSERNQRFREDNPEYFRNYYEKNRESELERGRKWQQSNPDKVALTHHRRQARQLSLPSTLTAKEYKRTLDHFGNACALTGRTNGLDKEHAIPLSIGHGGTTVGNCYPMASRLNQSKFNSNIFEWFNANKKRFKLPQKRFDALIDYLSKINGMTVQEYRDYVYWCHANPRNIDAD